MLLHWALPLNALADGMSTSSGLAIAQRALERRVQRDWDDQASQLGRMDQVGMQNAGSIHLRNRVTRNDGDERFSAPRWKTGEKWEVVYFRLEQNEQVEPFSVENRLLLGTGIDSESPLGGALPSSSRVLGSTRWKYEVLRVQPEWVQIEVRMLQTNDSVFSQSDGSSVGESSVVVHLLLDPQNLKIKRKLLIGAQGRARELSPEGLMLKRAPVELFQIAPPRVQDSLKTQISRVHPETLSLLRRHSVKQQAAFWETVDALGRPIDFAWDMDRQVWPSWMRGPGFLAVLQD